MARHHRFGLQAQQLVQRRKPAAAVSVADEGDAAREHDVAGKQHLVLAHDHHHIVRSVRRPHVDQVEVQPAQSEGSVAV